MAEPTHDRPAPRAATVADPAPAYGTADARPRPARRLPRRDPGMPRDIYVLSLVAFIVALGFGVVGPAIPLLADSFGVDHAAAASAISVFALFRFLSALVNGRLVELISARRVLAIGLVLQSVTTFAAGLAPSFVWVIVFRSLGGLGSAAFTVAAFSLLLSIAPPTHRGRAASTFQGGFLLGAIFGPAAGGFLAEITPRLPFLVYGVFLGVAGVVGMALLSRTVPTAAERGPDAEALLAEHADEGDVSPIQERTALEPGAPDAPGQPAPGGSWRVRAFVACLIANLGVGWMLYGVRSSLMPIYVVEELGRSAAWAGSAFLVGSVAQGLVLLRAGRLVDVWGRRPALLIGTGITCLSTVVLVAPAHLAWFLLAMAAFGAAGAFLGSAPAAVLGDISGGRPGRLVAAFQMASDGGAIVGPLVAGLLTDRYGYQAAFASGAVVLGLGFLAAISMPETAAGRRPA